MDTLKQIAKNNIDTYSPQMLKIMADVEKKFELLITIKQRIIVNCNTRCGENKISELLGDLKNVLNDIPETYLIYVVYDNQIFKNGKKISFYNSSHVEKCVPKGVDINKISYAACDKNPYFKHSYVPNFNDCYRSKELFDLYDLLGTFNNVKFVDNELCDLCVKLCHLGF